MSWIARAMPLVVALSTLCLLLRPIPALAHNPDTSYAQVNIGQKELECRFTCDLFTLLKIAPLDRNSDGRISRSELNDGMPAIQEFLRQHISIEIGGREAGLGEFIRFVWPTDAGDTIAERDYHAATSLVQFHFRKPLEETPENVALSFDIFTALGERHIVLGSFNYRGEPHEVTFNQFEPDYDFVTGFETPLWRRMLTFLQLGVRHIFLGYDHIAFLVALILVNRFRELVKIVTAFTVAHSITLILAALELVSLNTRLVETSIAATIVYVAVESIRKQESSHRWTLAFAFGLIHGFGFANVLREMELPRDGLIRCLLSFNVGVELGQLVIVLTLFPVGLALARWRHGRKGVVAISTLLALFGTTLFIDRAFALGFMPF